MSLRPWGFCVAASLVLAATVMAARWDAPGWTPESVVGRTDWYAVSMRGEQVGYLRVSYRREAQGYVLENRMELRGQAQGASFHQVQEEGFRFDLAAPHRVRAGWLREQGAEATSRRFDNSERGLRFYERQDAEPKRLPASRFAFGDALAPMAWSANGAGSDELATRSWDWEQRADGAEQYRRLKRDAAGLSVEQTTSGSQLKAEIRFAADGTPERYALGGTLVLSRTGAEQAMSFKASTDLYFGGGVPVDKALGAPRRVQRLDLALSPSTGATIPDAPGQVGGRERVRLTRPAAGGPVTEQERVAALALPARYGDGDADLVRLAQLAVAGASTPKEQLAKLVAFVAEYLADAPVLQPVTADEIAQARRGDCTEHAQLFVALARRLGLPAREISGLVYLGDSHQRFGGHAWAEVALDGRWQAVDPTWNQVGVDATHIRFGEGRAGEESLFLMQDGLRFSVLAVGYAD